MPHAGSGEEAHARGSQLQCKNHGGADLPITGFSAIHNHIASLACGQVLSGVPGFAALGFVAGQLRVAAGIRIHQPCISKWP